MSGWYQETLDVLRHIAVHGSRTRAEVVKAFEQVPTAGKAVDNLAFLGYLAPDGMTTPKTYILTKKARDKLAQPVQVATTRRRTRSGAGLPIEPPPVIRRRAAPDGPAAAPRQRVISAAHYQAQEFSPSLRPGAMHAYSLPSRMGNRLHWRDGHVTDLDGNPIPTP